MILNHKIFLLSHLEIYHFLLIFVNYENLFYLHLRKYLINIVIIKLFNLIIVVHFNFIVIQTFKYHLFLYFFLSHLNMAHFFQIICFHLNFYSLLTYYVKNLFIY
jgi:hypothetical protein